MKKQLSYIANVPLLNCAAPVLNAPYAITHREERGTTMAQLKAGFAWTSQRNHRLGHIALVILLLASTTLIGQAQTLTTLHNFTGGADGGMPWAGLTIDRGGNLYGTTFQGGNGFGTVYKLAQKNGNWTIAPLYKFNGGNDGANPVAPVILGPNGTLYGTTVGGGGTSNTCNSPYPVGCGIVFNLAPRPSIPPSPLTPWNETVLYRFQGTTDGAYPGYGDLTFDSAGNIYGTTSQAGVSSAQCFPLGCGVVFKLTHSGQGYTESVIYSFTGGTDGSWPVGAVVFNSTGEAYTTAGSLNPSGANGGGTVIELTPSGGGWTETTIHNFTPGTDGSSPWSGVILDSSGNLYGTTSTNGSGGGGTVFELMPSGGGGVYNVLQSFSGSGNSPGPLRRLVMDSAGNLYGTTFADGAHGLGSVFKLTHSGGGWTYTSLHDFTGGSDGANPYSTVVFDSSGNLYGTASAGGSMGQGVVWEITP